MLLLFKSKNEIKKMNTPTETGNVYLSMVSAFCAILSLSAIQPILTFIASIVGICSGLYVMLKANGKSKNK